MMIERPDATALSLSLDRAILAGTTASMLLEHSPILNTDTPEMERERVLDALAKGSMLWAMQDPKDTLQVDRRDAQNMYHWLQESLFGKILEA